jgi:type VI secretion system protein ImpK
MDADSSFALVSPDPTIVRLRSRPERRPATGAANPFVQAAVQVLGLAGGIRKQTAPTNLDVLHLQCVREIRNFEERIWRAELPEEQVIAASYAVCVVIDEAVLGLPGAARTNWPARSMSATFHGERSCGEKLLRFVQLASATPHVYLSFLELVYICLSIGFQAEPPVSDDATRELLQGRYDLLRSIQHARGEAESTAVPAAAQRAHRVAGRRSVRWAVASLALALLLTAAVLLILKGAGRSAAASRATPPQLSQTQ